MKKNILLSAIVSSGIVMGLLAGLPLGYMARNFFAAPSSSEIAMPQQD
ncbi:MAG: hypothetical protein AB1589_07985 [Cyanobacteriota bacterium]